MRNISPFSIRFYFQHQTAPFLYDSANNVSTDEIERLSISLKNNLCLSLPRIQILKIDRARYTYATYTFIRKYRSRSITWLATLCIRNKYMYTCARFAANIKPISMRRGYLHIADIAIYSINNSYNCNGKRDSWTYSPPYVEKNIFHSPIFYFAKIKL